MNVEKKWRWWGRNFPEKHHSFCFEGKSLAGCREKKPPLTKLAQQVPAHWKFYFYARHSNVHFVLPQRVPRNASRPGESHNSSAGMVWKGTCLEVTRANFQSCWLLIYEPGVCLPRTSPIHWLAGLTSPWHKRHDFYRCSGHWKAEICGHNYGCPI